MSGVASGRLRHKVQLQENQITQNPNTGEMVSDWVTVADVWASVEPLSVREFIAASAEQSEVTGKMVMRYRDDVTAAWRVVFRGKWYAIKGVIPDADSGREHMTIMTGEGVRLEQ